MAIVDHNIVIGSSINIPWTTNFNQSFSIPIRPDLLVKEYLIGTELCTGVYKVNTYVDRVSFRADFYVSRQTH